MGYKFLSTSMAALLLTLLTKSPDPLGRSLGFRLVGFEVRVFESEVLGLEHLLSRLGVFQT